MSDNSQNHDVRPVLIRQIPEIGGGMVTIKGWVTHVRSSGKLIFGEVRDGTGVIQTVLFKGDAPEPVFEMAKRLQIPLLPVISAPAIRKAAQRRRSALSGNSSGNWNGHSANGHVGAMPPAGRICCKSCSNALYPLAKTGWTTSTACVPPSPNCSTT